MTQQQSETGLTDEGPCTICRGGKKEHFDDQGRPVTQHAYTTREGDLVTPQEMAKRSAPQPRIIQLPGATQNEGGAINRLIETLLNKGVLTLEEALYICSIGPKPEKYSEELQRRFAEPPVSSGGITGARDC